MFIALISFYLIAPLGARCSVAKHHIALLTERDTLEFPNYKHVAPTEHK
jgi:hypothetical protein